MPRTWPCSGAGKHSLIKLVINYARCVLKLFLSGVDSWSPCSPSWVELMEQNPSGGVKYRVVGSAREASLGLPLKQYD